jgi:hypothetical protein
MPPATDKTLANVNQSRQSSSQAWSGIHPDRHPLSSKSSCYSGGDLVKYRRNDQFSVYLPQMRAAGGEFSDEFCPGQRRLPC